jgi:hypothetical protein
MASFTTLVTSLPKFGPAGASIARTCPWNSRVFAAATPRPIQVNNYSHSCLICVLCDYNLRNWKKKSNKIHLYLYLLYKCYEFKFLH